jgi:predicted membrane protein
MGIGKKLADASLAKISSLENQLSGVLMPVTPRSEFVHGLGYRIQARNQPSLVKPIVAWPILAAIIAGFVSLAVLVAMVMRALLSISARKRTT